MFGKVRNWVSGETRQIPEPEDVWRECPFAEHQWDPSASAGSGYEQVDWYCRVCKVGYTMRYVTVGAGQILLESDTYPAEGQSTISRAMLRYFAATMADTKSDLEHEQGLTITWGEQTIHARPVGM